MPTRGGNPRITIQADAAPVERAVANSERSLGRLEASAHKAGQGMKVGVAAGAVAATAGLGAFVDQVKESANAARESEVSQSKLEAQLKALGISYKAHAKQIDEVIQKTSKLSGLDDEDLQDAFTNVVRATGNVNGALKDMSVVADLARAKHLDVAKAGDLVAKVHNGNVGVLKRYGVAIDPVTKAQDALKASTKKATDEQVRAAKEQDKQATAQKALAELTDRFSGQAKKYGDTTQGSLDKAGVAWENLHEAIGSKVTPVLAKAALGFVGLLDKAQTLGPPIKRIAGDIGAFGQRVIAAFKGGDSSASGFATRVRGVVTQVIAFVRDLYTKVKAVFSGSGIGGDLLIIGRAWLKFQGIVFTVVGEIAKRVLPILTGAITGLAVVVRGVVRVIAGLLSGDFGKAWDGVKDIVRGAVKVIVAIVGGLGGLLVKGAVAAGKAVANGILDGLKGLAGLLWDKAKSAVKFLADPERVGKTALSVGTAIVNGIVSGLGSLGHLILDKLKAALGWVADKAKGLAGGIGKVLGMGDGIGRSVGSGQLPSGGAFGGSLMGARASLRPFAAIGSRFGLHVSDGKRPAGTRTVSGGVSYHSTGEAIDMADGRGPDANKLAFFNYLKSNFGGQLAELIYTPGGLGIKDGRPYRYTGSVAAEHYDHVHVAFDTGTPGVGDGIGFGGLESLWVQGGGSSSLAPLMAHVAQAESGGNPNAMNASGATGLWQILGKPFPGNAKDPLTNALMAVWKYKHQGLGAWAASRGTWGRYVGSGETYRPGASGSPAKGKTYKPGISNEPIGSLAVTGEDAGPDASSLLSPPAPRTVGELLNRSRPIKGFLPGDPIAEPVDRPEPVIPGVQTEFSDTIRMQAALAALTPGTDDDIAAANSGVWNAQIALDRAKASGNAGAIADTAEALKSAMDAVKALTDAVNQANEIQQQRDELNQTIADNQGKILALANQGPAILAAVIAAVNGGIGGQLGLGFQTPGYAGAVANYGGSAGRL